VDDAPVLAADRQDQHLQRAVVQLFGPASELRVSAPSVISSSVPGVFSARQQARGLIDHRPDVLAGFVSMRPVPSAWMKVSSKAGSSVGGNTRCALLA
jgi:hypothetical protein